MTAKEFIKEQWAKRKSDLASFWPEAWSAEYLAKLARTMGFRAMVKNGEVVIYR